MLINIEQTYIEHKAYFRFKQIQMLVARHLLKPALFSLWLIRIKGFQNELDSNRVLIKQSVAPLSTLTN